MPPSCRRCRVTSSPQEKTSPREISSVTALNCYRTWRGNALVLTALAVALLASGVSSSAVPAGEPSEEAPARKEFPVSRLRGMLKELFRKRRAQFWQGVFQNPAPRMGAMEGEEEGGRQRRDVGEEKKLLSLDQDDRLGTFVGEVMACQEIPGLSLGMTRGGARQGQGYGVADMDTARPVDKDTLFGIGSNTKAFAAASMAHLMVSMPLEKKFSFSTPLAEILDDFRLTDPTRTTQTTLMDVLSHRTGLASGDLGIFSGYPLNLTTREFCSRLQYLPEMVPFRSAWYYSNTMYVLVSRVCEATAGKNLTEVLREAIWQPLLMNNTVMAPEALSHDNVALPYILRMRVIDMFVQQDPKLFEIHPLQAAGAIMSSAMDMTKWLAHLLDVLRRPSGVAMSVLRQLFTERTLLPAYMRQQAGVEMAVPILHIGYGMGFMTSYYKGHMVYWHTGDLHGYTSMVLLVPDLDTGVFVAVNGPSGSFTDRTVRHVAYFVLELLQGRQPWVNLTQVCPGLMDPDPTSDPYDYDYDYPGDDTLEINSHSQVLLRPIEDYLGLFGHGLLGDLKIVREQERNSLLRMELGRLLVADLIPTKDANIFKLAPRAPVADTKEWEKEHSIVFKSSAVKYKSPAKDNSANDSKSETKETEVTAPLDMVQLKWELETYLFEKRAPPNDTALQEEEPEHDHKRPEKEAEVPRKASAVAGDSGAKTCFASVVQTALLLVLCSALMTQS